jgi:hypothetical protein
MQRRLLVIRNVAPRHIEFIALPVTEPTVAEEAKPARL